MAYDDEPAGSAPEAPVPLAHRCAEQLGAAILAGEVQPGERLDEVALGERLGVSRNTLREAFRLLGHDQLVEHRPNRGVFVAEVDAQAARQVYAVRRHLELGVLDDLCAQAILEPDHQIPADVLERMAAAVDDGERARALGDWGAVGTANAHFHLALAALTDNPVAVRHMRPLITQTRLRFLTMGNPRAIHEGFLAENRRLVELLRHGQAARARAALEVYLLRAEEEMG